MSLLKIEKDRLTIDGENFYLASGDIQYFRIHPSEWKARLQIMKDFGLTAIQTYCPWNLHEPSEGVFDFSGILDLERFLDICSLSLSGLGSGAAFINGFNIGRYLDVGPQRTLYVPGALLKDGENELVLLELSDKDVTLVEFVNDAVYDGEYRDL